MIFYIDKILFIISFLKPYFSNFSLLQLHSSDSETIR